MYQISSFLHNSNKFTSTSKQTPNEPTQIRVNGHLSEASVLERQDCKIFTKLVPLQAPSRSSHQRFFVKIGALKNW